MILKRLCLCFFPLGLVKFKFVDNSRILLDRYESRIYDQFGDNTTLLYHDSTIEIKCICNQFVPCTLNDSLQVIDQNGQVVTEAPISNENRLKFKVSRYMKLGEYRCRSKETGEISEEKLEFQYRLCAPDEELHSTCTYDDDDPRFCFVTKENDVEHLCHNLYDIICKPFSTQSFAVCTASGDEYSASETVCHAFVSMQKPIFMTTFEEICWQDHKQSGQLQLLSMGSKSYHAGEYVLSVQSRFRFKSSCTGVLANRYIHCQLKANNQTPKEMIDICGQEMEVSVDQIGLYVTKLLCTIHFSINDTKQHIAETFIFLVVMKTSFKILLTENRMECLIDAKRADVERSFALLAQWLLNGKNYLDEKEVPHEIDHNESINGTYVCVGRIHFRATSPYTHFTTTSRSEVTFVPATTYKFAPKIADKSVSKRKKRTSPTPFPAPVQTSDRKVDHALLPVKEDDYRNTIVLWSVLVGLVLLLVLLVLIVLAIAPYLLKSSSRKKWKRRKKHTYIGEVKPESSKKCEEIIENQRKENLNAESKSDEEENADNIQAYNIPTDAPDSREEGTEKKINEKSALDEEKSPSESSNGRSSKADTTSTIYCKSTSPSKPNVLLIRLEPNPPTKEPVQAALEPTKASIRMEPKKKSIRVAPKKSSSRMGPKKSSVRMEPKKSPTRAKSTSRRSPKSWFKSQKTLCGCTPRT